MTIPQIDLKWFQFHKRILRWQNKHRSDQNTLVDHARERSISTLQKRYGFDRDKAISELDRHYSKAHLWGNHPAWFDEMKNYGGKGRTGTVEIGDGTCRHFSLGIQIDKKVLKRFPLRARFGFPEWQYLPQVMENNNSSLMNAIGKRFQPLDL